MTRLALTTALLLGCSNPAPERAARPAAATAADPAPALDRAPPDEPETPPPERDKAPLDPWNARLSAMPATHCNDTGWCTLFSQPVGSRSWLGSIWTQQDQIFVAGGYGAVAHHNGEGWTLHQTPAQSQLREMAGSGPDDVYAVGSMLSITHWDGATWTAELGPKGNPRNDSCQRLLVVARGDVYVTCNRKVLHREDGSWRQVEPPTVYTRHLQQQSRKLPQPQPKACDRNGPTAHQVDGDEALVECSGRRLFRVSFGSASWRPFGKGELRGLFDYRRLGTRWLALGSDQVRYRDMDDSADAPDTPDSRTRWTGLPIPPEYGRPRSLHLQAPDGPLWVFGKEGSALRYDGQGWTAEDTGAQHAIGGTRQLGHFLLATAHDRILRRDLSALAAAKRP